MKPAQFQIMTLNRPRLTDFASARNNLLAQAKSPWVLFVDSDEQVTPELRAEIESRLQNPTVDAYRLRRRDRFLGRDLHFGENGHNRFVRLIRVGSGHFERPVHEVFVTRGRVGDLRSPLLHTLPSLEQFLAKINRYSSLEAEYRHQQNRESSLWQILVYPPAKFIYNYIFRLGFADGVAGLIMAALMSFHSYLTWAKLYLRGRA